MAYSLKNVTETAIMYGHIAALLIETMKDTSKEIEDLKGGR